MIFTILLNPTVDNVIYIPEFKEGGTYLCKKREIFPAGKALSVSLTLHTLGQKHFFIGVIGHFEIPQYNEFLLRQGIEHQLIGVEGKTRSNISIIDDINSNTTHLRFPGFNLQPPTVKEIIQILIEKVSEGDYIIFSGSNPRGVPENFYLEISEIVRHKKAHFIIDTSGPALRHMMNYNLLFMKGNISEFSEIIGEMINNNTEFNHFPTRTELNEISDLIRQKSNPNSIPNIITLAEYGALVVFRDKVHHIHLNDKKFSPAYTIGCGDAFLGGVVASLQEGNNILTAVKLGTACGAANTLITGPGAISHKDVKILLQKVNIVEI